MNRCKLCVAPVLKSQDRKQLASLTSASCVAVLVDLACTKRKADAALQGANAVKVVVTYDGCEKRYVLSPKKERIGKSLGRNIKRAFAQYSLESEEMGKHLLARIHKMIRVEMKNVLKENSLAENLYATTPSSSPSLSEYSFVGNISPITPEVSCVSYDESDDIPSEPNEYPSQSTPVPAGNEGNEEWYGFRLVGDNVDKNVKPRDMRLNSQTTSLHYFHTYAVKDRIWFSHLSTDPIEIVQDSINFEMFYPTVGDNTQLVSNLETLVARMFVQRVPGLQSLSAEATPHIKHLYSKQMALKSEVIHVTLEGVALDRGHWIHVTLEGVALDRGHWIHVTLEGVALDRGHWIHVTLEGVELDRGHWIHVTLEGVALDSCSEGKQFEALASTTRNSPVVALQWIAEQLVQRVEEPAVESFLDSCRV
ncbi:hypothetical protein EMCRGX_G023170 [Ephydatia muelleri]